MENMFKCGFFRKSSVVIAIALCAALATPSFADPRGRFNNPHTNQEVIDIIKALIQAYFDSRNNSGGGGDGNNGHGNDESGSDPSNPGQSGNPRVGSVLDLLGVEEDAGSGSSFHEPPDSPVITLPTTVTSDPFGEAGSSDDESSEEPTSTALPYGSVPLIKEDAVSVDYLLQKILMDAQLSAEANGESTDISPAKRAAYEEYARKLAKTLSKLSPREQDFIFYGVRT